jgi:hypothetical protein
MLCSRLSMLIGGFCNGEYFRCMVYLHCGVFEVKV